MTKTIALMRKRADMSAEDFRRHLEEVHMPLLRKIPGIQRIVNNHVVASVDGSPPPYDLIGEAWFPSVESMQAAYAGPEGQAALADVPNFVDPAQMRILIVEED